MTPTGLALYTDAARQASARVIGAYSTSFGLASTVLTRPVRTGIADVYALVRIADEIVDGPAAQAGLGSAERRAALDTLESDTIDAMQCGFSANLIVHAFACTARTSGITPALVRPFFASMRMDIDPPAAFDDDAYRRYIHGSAEVVGSMCLRVFLLEPGATASAAALDAGARRLGAAFQKVNFLRDLADDTHRLHRSYLPGAGPAGIDEDAKRAVVDEIDADLRSAAAALPALPPRARKATTAAALLFGRLNRQLAATPAAQLQHQRASVPGPIKVMLLLRALAGGGLR